MKTKNKRKSPEQLKKEIESLIIQRFGEGAKFLLMAVEKKNGFCNYFTNDAAYMFDYGAVIYGRFCENAIEEMNKRDEESI